MFEKYFTPQLYLPLIYICVAILINGIIKRLINRLIISKTEKSNYNYKKTETFKVLLKNISKYVIILLTILAVLTVYGVDVTSVLAGLGIVGIVVGLALQDLAKDIVAGVSLILENQYAIGDIISIGNFKGEVIFLGLRTTKLKNYEGQVKIIANRNISELVNHSMSNSLAIVNITLSNDYDLEKTEIVLKEVIEVLNNKLEDLKGKVELLGITELTLTSTIYQITVPTKSMKHEKVERIIRKEIKQALLNRKKEVLISLLEVNNGK